ncbi:MAG: acetyl-CoA carboxylase, carboxyltransferase subunit beta [Phycisphaerae bacterium]
MARDGETVVPFDPSVFEGPALRKKREVPDGLWMRCAGCEEMVYRKVVAENMEVCPKCGYHVRVGAVERIRQLTDPDSFEELFADIVPDDPLGFEWRGKTYREYIREYQERSGTAEGVLTGIGYVKGRRVALGVMNGEFVGGSMGSVSGERLTLLIERATEAGLPLVIVCTSGGMRMQEGALSLVQMAKTSAALAKLDEAGGLYVSVLVDPTTGGTTASIGMLADVILAEPGAMIGFAGPRVIANTIRQELPDGFQRAEFLLEHGFVDIIVERKELRSELARLVDYCQR